MRMKPPKSAYRETVIGSRRALKRDGVGVRDPTARLPLST